MGIATTVDYLQRFLPSSALGQLVATAFILKSPIERLESVVRAVLVDSFCAFELSHLVAKHLHMHFLRYDLTVSSFVMSLKVGHLPQSILTLSHPLFGTPSVLLLT